MVELDKVAGLQWDADQQADAPAVMIDQGARVPLARVVIAAVITIKYGELDFAWILFVKRGSISIRVRVVHLLFVLSFSFVFAGTASLLAAFLS